MSEQWYDEVIAPKLKAISDECGAKGCAFVAVVEYAPDKRGSTLYTPPGTGLPMILLRALDRAGDNIDAFMIAVSRYCQREGIDTSSSIYLSRPLGDSPRRGRR